MACRSRYTSTVYTGINVGRGDCRIVRKNRGRCKRIFLPAYLPAVYQLGFCADRFDAEVVRAFAENQPVTSIVETIRALLSGQLVGNDIWIALARCVVIMLVSYIFAMRRTNGK